jgi:hypothetical protein
MWDWLNCVVFSRHENAIWCENGAIYLRCLRCGHRSSGWDVEGTHDSCAPHAAPSAPLRDHRTTAILTRVQAATAGAGAPDAARVSP